MIDEFNARMMMSDAKFFEAYSRFDDSLNRYETWEESVARVMNMHRQWLLPFQNEELRNLITETQLAYEKKLILGAQRALQFGGDQLLKHQARMYNCAASYCDRPEFFSEAFYLMLCGTGVGFSVQYKHVNNLPTIEERTKAPIEYIIEDSIEGWADSLDVLLASYFNYSGKHKKYKGHKVLFNFDSIRPKGSYISGGFKAPGSESLKASLEKIQALLYNEIKEGRNKLRPIIAYDIVMHVADAVISGGVRRSATICLFSKEDSEMLTAKTGDWFITNPQRGRSNNSAVLLRDETTLEELNTIMKSVKDVGEPGFVFSDSLDALFNPCVEIGQYGYYGNNSGWQACNLTEINGGASTTPEIFYEQCKYASILGTIQASYTDFKYLSDTTRKIIEREALIGVSITGWMNNPKVLFDKEVMKKGAEVVKYWNKVTADLININQAARTTCVKPSGNASVLLGTSSGIHGEHSPLYLRYVQFNKESEIAKLFMNNFKDMCEDSVWARDRDITVAFPIISPKTSIFKKDLLGTKQLEYVKLAQDVWIEEGTNYELCVQPWLRHNVSNTITVDDWDKVTKYVFDNRYSLCGISFLSASGDRAYPQAPFTEVLTYQQIIDLYGEVAMFTSALIEAGLLAFNNDLWTACNTALGYGEVLEEGHEFLLKRDFVRRFNKFSLNFKDSNECANCLKDVHNLHKWWRIQKNIKELDFTKILSKKDYVDINTTGAQACSGGQCELQF